MTDKIASDKLTLCGDRVLWDGHEVEHVTETVRGSYDWDGLRARCQHLEELNVPVRSSTVVWFRDWFKDVKPGARYLDLLRMCPGLWEHGMLEPRRTDLLNVNCPWSRLQEPSGSVYFTYEDLIVEWDGEDLIATILEPDNRYHTLKDQDIHVAQCGQPIMNGPCYATYEMVVTWLDNHDVSPRTASQIAKLLKEQ